MRKCLNLLACLNTARHTSLVNDDIFGEYFVQNDKILQFWTTCMTCTDDFRQLTTQQLTTDDSQLILTTTAEDILIT